MSTDTTVESWVAKITTEQGKVVRMAMRVYEEGRNCGKHAGGIFIPLGFIGSLISKK